MCLGSLFSACADPRFVCVGSQLCFLLARPQELFLLRAEDPSLWARLFKGDMLMEYRFLFLQGQRRR